MNPLLQRLMNEAARLTRNGQLHAATEALQRALRGLTGRASSPPVVDVPASTAAHASSTAADAIVNPKAERDTGLDAKLTDLAPAEPEAAPYATPAPARARMIERPFFIPPVTPSAPVEPERWTDGNFSHQGRTLAYKLFVPARAASPAPGPRPLLLMLHGCNQNPGDFAAGTQMNQLAREQGFVVLYPAQTAHANAQQCWNWFKPQHQQRGRGEPALLAALTQAVMAEQAIDPARVYVAGLSAGAAMADILGRCYPDLFAAVGVHSGLPTGAADNVVSALAAMHSGTSAAPAPLNDGAMPPVIVFHGDADATVHPSNGDSVVSAARGLQPGNASASEPTEVTQGHSTQGQHYTQTVYVTADGRRSVEHWLLHGAGHAWSGGSATGSYTDPRGADASAEMLRFFMAHPRI